MFAKLKKKIEEEVQTDLSKSLATTSATPSPSSSRKYGSRQTSPSRLSNFDRERRASVSSTDSKDSFRHSETSEDLSSLLKTKTEQVKRLEIRLQEYYCALQTQLDCKSKLEDELAKQKALTEVALKNKDEEYKRKIGIVELERDDLNKKLESAKLLHNSFIEKQEVIEELEGFQTQEMAKVKHMFLNCQQELQTKKEEINSVKSELESAKSTITRLSNENKVFQDKLDKDDVERVRLNELEISNSSLVNELTETNSSLLNQITSLKKELEENNSKNNRLEQDLSDLRDEIDAMRHSHEIYYESSNKQLEEKNSFISHLEERISTLEQRVSLSNLNEDEQYRAVVTERDNLEKKLEESRQQLIEIKSTWSEKIVSLEKQISHLNKKMAEDNLEMSRLEENAELAEKNSSEKISALNDELANFKVKYDDLNKLIKEERRSWENEKIELENELKIIRTSKENNDIEAAKVKKSLENDIFNLRTEKEKEKIKYEELKAETDSELTKQATELGNYKEINNKLQEAVGLKEEEIDKQTKALEVESSKVIKFENELKALSDEKNKAELFQESLKKHLSTVEQQLEKVIRELESEKELRKKVESDLKNCHDDGEQLKSKLHDHTNLLETTRIELDKTKQLLSDAEDAAKGNIAKSEQVLDLNKLVSNLENELLDKNKTIRLQQQRINDMKKTLQRELKMQIGGALEVTNGEESLAETSKNFGSTGSLSQRDIPAEFVSKIQNNDATEPHLVEDVNFRYLKHVILKFMTSREYEAQHLIKAVSVLLHFTADEERLIRDTLDWKMSWFGSKPKFGSGQLSKTIPTTS